MSRDADFRSHNEKVLDDLVVTRERVMSLHTLAQVSFKDDPGIAESYLATDVEDLLNTLEGMCTELDRCVSIAETLVRHRGVMPFEKALQLATDAEEKKS